MAQAQPTFILTRSMHALEKRNRRAKPLSLLPNTNYYPYLEPPPPLKFEPPPPRPPSWFNCILKLVKVNFFNLLENYVCHWDKLMIFGSFPFWKCISSVENNYFTLFSSSFVVASFKCIWIHPKLSKPIHLLNMIKSLSYMSILLSNNDQIIWWTCGWMKLIPNVIKLLFNNDYNGFNRL